MAIYLKEGWLAYMPGGYSLGRTSENARSTSLGE